MTTDRARRVLIIASLAITGLQIVFLVIAPVVDYPLTYPKNLDLLQIVTPVFLGYLGSAAHFVFKPAPADETTASPYLGLLTVGPLAIYAAAVAAAVFAFGYSNRRGAPIGSGMSVDNLATTLSIALGVLAATTGVLVSYLFSVGQTKEDSGRQPYRRDEPDASHGAT